MHPLHLAFLIAGLTLVQSFAYAESFMGINARSRIGSVQTLFPNAAIKDSKPAWLQPYQRLVEISGPGIDGTLAVKLEHEVEGTRALAKELAMQEAAKTLEPWQSSVLSYLPDKLAKLEKFPPADPWEVKDIRWAPPTPIPVRAASTKYGAPDTNVADEQFRRTLGWSKRGITAYVDQNELVTLFVFTFTMREYACSGPDAPVELCKASEPSRKEPAATNRGTKQ